MTTLETPQLCDSCSYIAMAIIDGKLLCLGCLLEQFKQSADPYFVYKIQPLRFEHDEIKGLIRSRDEQSSMLPEFDKVDTLF
ncbi:MAG: hypothetical protein GY854_20975 [Deltaproteobacteria bacterium]|nr:hypothetical protein [Deltaproteobacteria bacterium]